MDKKLLLKRIKYRNEIETKNDILMKLESFLSNHKDKFDSVSAIDAINKIEQYLLILNKDYELLLNKYQENEKIIMNNCKHEILNDNHNQYVCLMCGKDFIDDVINFEHYVVNVKTECNYNLLIKTIENIIMDDKNIMEVLEDYLLKVDLEDIKIYRR